jgi:hypothetical protein
MKFPMIVKNTALSQNPADWIDHARVDALVAQAEAAQTTKDPVDRYLALRAAAADLSLPQSDAETHHERKIDVFFIKRRQILTAEGQKSLKSLQIASLALGYAAMMGILGTGVMAIGLLAAIPSPFLVDAALFVGGQAGMFGAFNAAGHGIARAVRRKTAALQGPVDRLAAARQSVNAALAESEQSLSLEDVRKSPRIDVVLDASPTLKARFAEEATRAAIKGQVAAALTAPEARVVPQKLAAPSRKTIGV